MLTDEKLLVNGGAAEATDTPERLRMFDKCSIVSTASTHLLR
jgi:hypothetical protein